MLVPVPQPAELQSGPQADVHAEPVKADAEPALAIRWEHDERAARARARRAALPLLVFLHAEWSAASNQVDRTVWSNPEVTRRIRGFVAVRVDLSDAEGDAQLYADHYQVRQLPSVVIENVAGARAAQIEGMFDAAQLLIAMEKAYE